MAWWPISPDFPFNPAQNRYGRTPESMGEDSGFCPYRCQLARASRKLRINQEVHSAAMKSRRNPLGISMGRDRVSAGTAFRDALEMDPCGLASGAPAAGGPGAEHRFPHRGHEFHSYRLVPNGPGNILILGGNARTALPISMSWQCPDGFARAFPTEYRASFASCRWIPGAFRIAGLQKDNGLLARYSRRQSEENRCTRQKKFRPP